MSGQQGCRGGQLLLCSSQEAGSVILFLWKKAELETWVFCVRWILSSVTPPPCGVYLLPHSGSSTDLAPPSDRQGVCVYSKSGPQLGVDRAPCHLGLEPSSAHSGGRRLLVMPPVSCRRNLVFVMHGPRTHISRCLLFLRGIRRLEKVLTP